MTLSYGCLNEDGETRVYVNLGGATRSATIREIHDPVPKERTDADHNGVKTSSPIHVMTWAEIHVGDFDLSHGSTDLTVSIDPKGTLFELKEARVTLIGQ